MFLEFDEQITGYLKALDLIHGVKHVGAVFTYLLVKKPSVPKNNKNGSMSKAKCFSTPQVYFDAVKAAGLNPWHYVDVIKQQQHNEWFKRFVIYKTEDEKDGPFFGFHDPVK